MQYPPPRPVLLSGEGVIEGALREESTGIYGLSQLEAPLDHSLIPSFTVPHPSPSSELGLLRRPRMGDGKASLGVTPARPMT